VTPGAVDLALAEHRRALAACSLVKLPRVAMRGSPSR
jgi:hypothetical protein